MLKAFETAEIEKDPSRHQDLLTFVLVGAGPTGVEMAGALAEMRLFTLKSDFRRIDPQGARIILAEASSRILANFPEELSRKAQARLESAGVEVRLGRPVKTIDEATVVIGAEIIPCRTVIWTAGVTPSPEEWKEYISSNPRFNSLLEDESVLRSLPANTPEDKKEEHLHRIIHTLQKRVERTIQEFISTKQVNEDSIQESVAEIHSKAILDRDSLADYDPSQSGN